MSNPILANISVFIPIDDGAFRKPVRNSKANRLTEVAVQNISDQSLPVIFLQGQCIQGSDIRKIDAVSSSSCKAHSPATSIMSETETRATCAEDGLFFSNRRSVSEPLPQSYFESPGLLQSNYIELGHLNKKLKEIKEKSSDILDRLNKLSQNDKYEICSDIYFYPSEISDEDIEGSSIFGLNPPIPPLRRSYSKPEFTHKESLFREFLAVDSEKAILQILIENFLTNALQFVEFNDELEEIDKIVILINSIEDLDEESLQCPEDLEECLNKAKLEVESVIKRILNNELFSFSYNTPAISESSESSDSVGYLSHNALDVRECETNYDTASESSESSDDEEYSVGYLSRIAGSVSDSKNKDEVLNIMQLFEGIQNLHSQRDILDFDEVTYLKKALKDLQQKFIKMSKPAV